MPYIDPKLKHRDRENAILELAPADIFQCIKDGEISAYEFLDYIIHTRDVEYAAGQQYGEEMVREFYNQ